MLLKKFFFSLFIFFFFIFNSYAQHFTRCDTIPVSANSKQLKFPWQGGHDYCQFSNLDINGDGINDLFVFDRTGNKVSCYISKGTHGVVDYLDSTIKYAPYFPTMQCWALCVDYNCDGKADIFTSSINPSGIRVYKNISTPYHPQFVLEKNYLYEGTNFIPANTIGLPAITDVDGDGDIDILTYSTGSFMMDFYINQSKDLYGKCDSLVFTKYGGCWGHFEEGGTSSCNVALGACKIATNPIEKTIPKPDDNGSSCALCVDLNGDGAKELLLGQSACCTIMQLNNGGNADTANMVSFTTNFPSTGSYVNMRYNPCGFYVDVNNDTIRDMLVAPNLPNVSLNNGSIWYYKNTGTDNSPVLQLQTKNFLQEEMIDVGQGADPVLFDYDNDGKQDLLISNYVLLKDSCSSNFIYGIFAYRNVGTASSPQFVLADSDYANISSQLPNITDKHLTFGDLDNDGDDDLFIGDYNGNLHYFENTAPSGQPANFVLMQANYKDVNGNVIDLGSNTTPQLIDIDRDGDLDLIVGERKGGLNFLQNIGTKTVPSYSVVSTSFGGIDVMKPCCTGFSVPFVYDYGGKYKMLVGSEATKSITGPNLGWIWMFDNIDGNLGGTFNPIDSMVQKIWEGPRMCIYGKDITNDGKMDIVIGNYCGGAAMYLGDTLSTGISELAEEDFDFYIYPNPTSGKFQITTSKFQISNLEIYNLMGEKILTSPQSPNNFTIDISEFPVGIYFCKASGKNFNPNGLLRSRTKKIILLK